jgi:carboxypeptidase C (cathepsin A)
MFALLVILLSCRLIAQQAPPAAPATAAAKEGTPERPQDVLPPLPGDAHIDQTMQFGGRALKYTVTVGTVPVYGTDGKKTGEVVFTAYTMEGPDRPVTFALNGGPGAASVYLNFGAIGPKRVPFGDEGQ